MPNNKKFREINSNKNSQNQKEMHTMNKKGVGMSLRTKIILSLIFVIGLILCLFGILGRTVLLSGFKETEIAYASESSDRIHNAIFNEAKNLGVQVRDWAQWDDTYRFITDKNKAYIKANLQDSSLLTLRSDIWALFDVNKTLVFGKEKSKGTVFAPLDYVLAQAISVSGILNDQNAFAVKSGLARFAGNDLLFSLYPVVKSDNTGPSRGHHFAAIRLDESFIKKVSSLTQLNFNLYYVSDLSLPLHLKKKVEILLNKQSDIEYISDSELKFYTVLQDHNLKPYFLLELNLPRSVFKVASRSLWTFFALLIITALLLGSIVLMVVEETAIKKILKMQKDVHEIEKSGDLSKRLSIDSFDELSNLGISINQMLDAIDKSKRALKLLFDCSEHAILCFSRDGMVGLDFSKKVETIWGRNPARSHISNLLQIDYEECNVFLDKIFNDPSCVIESILPTKIVVAGKEVDIRYSPLADAEKNITQIMLIATESGKTTPVKH